MADPVRPRLLYFNGPWDYLGDRMRKSYIDPFHALLAQDFEMISVEGNRDFRAEVELHRPEVVLFHTGCEAPQEPEVVITNTDAYPELPRMGYIYRDPFSPSRMMAMNRLNHWGVDQTFTCFRPSDAPIPFFENTFYLPWWIDDTLFGDYGERKTLPVTLTGSGWLNKCIYTWRNEIFCGLVPRFPIFHAPSLGNRQTNHDYVGEKYARLLNRSHFSAGCGTLSRYLTLKLLEIPASRCCLIAEEIDVLKEIGFVDGVNCVFATGTNVADKVQGLLNDPTKLAAITDAGWKLVQERHTQRSRRMFSEWFQLWENRTDGQSIVQTHPLEPLKLVDRNQVKPVSRFPTENPVTEGLIEGYRLMEAKSWTPALEKFEWILKTIPCVAEARLGAALCQMRLGRPSAASPHLGYNMTLLVQHFGYAHPDPIDLAFIAVLCIRMKDVSTAVATLAKYPQIRHPALNAMRWILAQANPSLADQPAFQVRQGDDTATVLSVHLLPQRTFAEFSGLLLDYLK
ncbi:MAG: glycosyltransferase [Opitutus sp.]